MDFGDYDWGFYRDYYRDPFPPSLTPIWGLKGLEGLEGTLSLNPKPQSAHKGLGFRIPLGRGLELL